MIMLIKKEFTGKGWVYVARRDPSASLIHFRASCHANRVLCSHNGFG
jgi:hypothetical protein